MSISNRLLEMPVSPIRKLVPYANLAKKQGVKIYHLNIGDPDIKTPEVMLDVLHKWQKNPISYSQSQGEPEFLEAIKYYYHKLGFRFIKTENIQVTTGGSEAISFALFAICDPGDEVIVFEPFYANYNSYAKLNQIKLIPVLTKLNTGFHLPNQKEIEVKITKKTKAIFICNPNNPTGTVYSKKEMEMLINIVKKHNLFLLSDEVYREFCYDNKKQISLLSYFNKIPKQAILLDSLSKRYSLCGARLGMIISQNTEIMEGILKIAQGRLASGQIDQLMAAKLTKVPQTYLTKVNKEYKKRRDILYSGLKLIQGIEISKPEGAFYIIIKLPVADSEDFCKWLLTDFRLNNETVMLAPAGGFYSTKNLGKNEVRIAYVLNTDDLKKSIEIIKQALIRYNQLKESKIKNAR